MVRLILDGRPIEGMPLAWDTTSVRVLGRDGRLWEFDPSRATDFRKTAEHFASYSVSELRAALLRELGQDFEVTGTGHYLVAHRRHEGEKWAERFEELYRSFVHYFSVRGAKPSPAPFPLVGIVCRDREEYYRYARQQGQSVPAGVIGYYAADTNRIVLFDMGGAEGTANWRHNASVLIHEATHQTAFNTGIHSRYSPPPRWLAEGLATMFEAPGVHDSRNHTQLADRINRGRFAQFQQLAARHRPELLVSLVQSDELFRISPAAAYAEAWALNFFLVETEPQKYAKYLAATARRPAFEPYTAAQRRSDFVSVFGSEWRMFEARFLRFMATLR
jgi:hypothetical protein